MSVPNQSSSPFPTFLQYWKNLIQPARRTVPIIGRASAKTSGKRSEANTCRIEGVLSISATGSYAIDGKDFAIDAETIVLGDLKIGSNAKVSCTVDGAKKRAIKITIA